MLRQFVFGGIVESDKPFSASEVGKLIEKGKKIADEKPLPAQGQIIKLFSQLAKAWSSPAYPRRVEASEALLKSTGMSRAFIDAVLDKFPESLNPETIKRKIEGELGDALIQEEPALQVATRVRLMARPVGTVLHVASGNVFLAGAESLIDGIITKNVNFLKMSTQETSFPVIFAESIKEFDKEGVIAPRVVILWWRGGDSEIESLFKKKMDKIIFWGGYDALLSWKEGLGQGTEFIPHGPKISFGVISAAGLDSAEMGDLTERAALDITIWEQKACNCPQVFFIESSAPEEKVDIFIGSLARSLESLNGAFPPAKRTDDEHVEILKTRELAMARSFVTGEKTLVVGPATLDWTIIYEKERKNLAFELSPLNRTIIIKRYQSLAALLGLFRKNSFYLQTIGYCLSEDEVGEYAKALSREGVTRLCPFGVMAIPTPGAPHDGSYALRGLTRLTVVE